MITLGIDTSAAFVSAALVEDDNLLGESFARGGQTHSASLLPMIDELLRRCGQNIADVNRFAATTGPGSFTGVRIGAAAVKGLAHAANLPCAGVSTLLAMAALGAPLQGVLCCAMDARREQIYAALFSAQNEGSAPLPPLRLTPDMALPIAELEIQLAQLNRPVYFLGDGAQLCYDNMQQRPSWQLAPQQLRYQRAYGAVLAAREEDYQPPAALAATYLRPSQAERELKK